ncbi:MAG TPA: fumarylacetoacetate hydrolase family protein [Polyangiales bacterium]|nr:fumarylacetoacetate hydrolase family protein [Polyangiales bacterium]
MRIYRIDHRGQARFARAKNDRELELWSAAPWAGGTATSESTMLEGARLLAPVTPSKIVCVGRNYAAHAKELGNQVPEEPLIFLKPPSSLLAPEAAIALPPSSQRVEHEAEIGIVIGARLKTVDTAAAISGIFGVTAVNDVTARDLQRKEVQFTRAKSFDTFCPVGPAIETEIDLATLKVSARVNGQLRQDGRIDQMIFGLAALISFISHVMTLEPGDLISTGTPEGVAPIAAGDVVEIEVSGVGVLRNPVIAAI